MNLKRSCDCPVRYRNPVKNTKNNKQVSARDGFEFYQLLREQSESAPRRKVPAKVATESSQRKRLTKKVTGKKATAKKTAKKKTATKKKATQKKTAKKKVTKKKVAKKAMTRKKLTKKTAKKATKKKAAKRR